MSRAKKWDPDAVADMVAEAINLDPSGCIDEEIRTAEDQDEAIRRMEEMLEDCAAALICIRGPGWSFPKIDARDLATILAALRLWQLFRKLEPALPNAQARALLDIATDSGKIERLDPQEIDQLCERLNTEA